MGKRMAGKEEKIKRGKTEEIKHGGMEAEEGREKQGLKARLLMCLLYLAVLSTATYAWFTMNNKPKVLNLALSAAAAGDLACERYVLDKGKLQVEVLTNLDQVMPAGAVLVVSYPRIEGATGLPARVWAITE